MRKTRRMKKIKNKKGITLITLVVTLIVLLIIAGITISSTYSEKGIIDNTNNIKRKNAESVIEEEIKNTIMGRAYTTGVFTPRKYEYAI